VSNVIIRNHFAAGGQAHKLLTFKSIAWADFM